MVFLCIFHSYFSERIFFINLNSKFIKGQKLKQHSKIIEKANEIHDLIQHIADIIPDDDPMLSFAKDELQLNSSIILAKLAGAEAVNLYDIKMENAALIRKAARDIMVSYHTFKSFDFKEAEYLMMVRELIEEFRILFVDWVASFDQRKFIVDTWGLFNPPGIGPDYEQSDDELDFLDED